MNSGVIEAAELSKQIDDLIVTVAEWLCSSARDALIRKQEIPGVWLVCCPHGFQAVPFVDMESAHKAVRSYVDQYNSRLVALLSDTYEVLLTPEQRDAALAEYGEAKVRTWTARDWGKYTPAKVFDVINVLVETPARVYMISLPYEKAADGSVKLREKTAQWCINPEGRALIWNHEEKVGHA
jgi:hypothetical protein